MPKPNPLMQALEPQSEPVKRRAATVSSQPGPVAVPPSRAGRVLIGGHFDPAVQRQLKIIAAEEGTTIQQLLAEAVNAVFAKRHKPEIADLGK